MRLSIIITMNSNSIKIKWRRRGHTSPCEMSHLNIYRCLSILLTLSAFLEIFPIVDPVSGQPITPQTNNNNKLNPSQQQQYQSTSFASVNNNNNKSTNSRSHIQIDETSASRRNEYALYSNDDNNDDAIQGTWLRQKRQTTFDADSAAASSTDRSATDSNQDDNLDDNLDETTEDKTVDSTSQNTPTGSQDYTESSSQRPIEISGQFPRSTLAVQVPPLITDEKPMINESRPLNDAIRQQSTLHRRTAPQLFSSDQTARSPHSSSSSSNNNNLLQTIPTMNVNIGADRILIKSANAESSWTSTSPAATSLNMNTNNNNEQYNRDLQLDDGAPSERHHHLDFLYPSVPTSSNSDAMDSLAASPQHATMHELKLNQQQQQGLLRNNNNNHNMQVMMLPTSDLNARMDQLSGVGGFGDTQAHNGPQICYTPITLMLVILITMTATLVVAILMHYTMKQLGRRQFDLIESTKQFDTEHQRGHSNQKPMFMLGAANPLESRRTRSSSVDNGCGRDDDDDDYIDHLGPLGMNSSIRKQNINNNNNCRDLRQARCLTANELEHFAFDNPYFRGCDDPVTQTAISDGQNQLKTIAANNTHSTTTTATNFTSDSSLTSQREHQQQRGQRRNSAGLLAVVGQQHQTNSSALMSCSDLRSNNSATCNNMNSSNNEASSSGNTTKTNSTTATKPAQQAPGYPDDPVNDAPDLQSFIEHHISNLHSRQVTSSVKALTISGRSPELKLSIGPNCELREPLPAIVDLRYDQRNMVNAKEGDLVAVDLSGQDFIGLGFDICGNVREGIFISSILASGPARESGLIHRGDRIKCLNISFEGVTLEDARDILNCGAPYKLRLLLEKGKESARQQTNQQSNKSLLTHSTGASKRSRSKTMNFLTDKQSSTGPFNGGFNATKSYIKNKLSNLVSPALSLTSNDQLSSTPTHKSAGALNSYVRTSPNHDNSNSDNFTTSHSEPEIKSSPPSSSCARDFHQPGHGSLANKRHLSSGEKVLNLTSVGMTSNHENNVT